MPERARESDAAGPRFFATTHWSVVTAAGEARSKPDQAQRALETLCRAYWYPIYAYARRKGYKPEESEDLTQEFFAQLIAKDHFRLADRSKGRFRGFLLATLDYFLAREWTRAHRQKLADSSRSFRWTSIRRRSGISWSPRILKLRRANFFETGR